LHPFPPQQRLASRIARRWRDWRVWRQTRRGLYDLDDLALRDIGFHRAPFLSCCRSMERERRLDGRR